MNILQSNRIGLTQSLFLRLLPLAALIPKPDDLDNVISV